MSTPVMQEEVKETALPLKAATAKAVHSGHKTQFRCAMAPQPPADREAILLRFPNQKGSPWGEIGDLLWVREPLRYAGRDLVYAADDTPVDSKCIPKQVRITRIYTPSLLMPRWAHRLTLEIVDVRVERVQQISCADVLAEGSPVPLREHSNPELGVQCVSAKEWFSEEWDRLNRKYGYTWATNPWVWVIEFKKL